MVASSTLVNVAEEAELRLVSVLAQRASSSDFLSKCQTCIDSGDVASLIKVVIGDGTALSSLVQIESDEDAVGAVSILAALLGQVSPNDLEIVLDALVKQEGPQSRKLVLLSVMYNMRTSSKEKCVILARMYVLASEADLQEEQALGRLLSDEPSGSLAETSSPRIVGLLDSWRTDIDSRRYLYQTIADCVTGSTKQRFLLLLVATYSDAPDATGLEITKQALVGALRDPMTLFSHQRNLLNTQAVKALRKSEAALVGLFEVFAEGKLSDYQQFLKQNGGDGVLTGYGLDSSQCERYMKILSLCSLAAEHEEIPYQTVADTLQSDVTEVEAWVIAAVESGLLEAKMDQLSQKVMVERCVVRRFDMEQWKALQSRLESWKSNVASVLETLEQKEAI